MSRMPRVKNAIAPDRQNHDPDYTTGYGRPPKEHRFKRGVSGNPRGRPRKRKTVSEVAYDLLSEVVSVSQGGEPKRMPAIEAVLRQLRVKAIKGDQKAALLLVTLASAAAAESHQAAAQGDGLSAADKEILEMLEAKFTPPCKPDSDS